MELHDRMIRASFWMDEEVMDWPAGKMLLYIGTWQAAENTGCLEDSPRLLHALLFPGRDEPTVADVRQWLDEFKCAGRLVAYKVAAKPYLYVRHFARHQDVPHLGAKRAHLPVPGWVELLPVSSDPRKLRITHSLEERERRALAADSLGDDCPSLTQASNEPKGTQPNGKPTEPIDEQNGREGGPGETTRAGAGNPDGPPPAGLSSQEAAVVRLRRAVERDGA